MAAAAELDEELLRASRRETSVCSSPPSASLGLGASLLRPSREPGLLFAWCEWRASEVGKALCACTDKVSCPRLARRRRALPGGKGEAGELSGDSAPPALCRASLRSSFFDCSRCPGVLGRLALSKSAERGLAGGDPAQAHTRKASAQRLSSHAARQ